MAAKKATKKRTVKSQSVAKALPKKTPAAKAAATREHNKRSEAAKKAARTRKKTEAKLEGIAAPAPPLSLLEQQEKAVSVVDHTLDLIGEKVGEAAILELRNEFDKLKHHQPFRKLFAIARFGQAPQ